jgi:hypothetical protein
MRTATAKSILPKGNPKSKMSKGKCKSCVACRNNPRLRLRYYNAWFNREPGAETLEMIGQELSISNNAIYRHAHNHMRRKVSKVQAPDQVTEVQSQLKAQAMKELEISFDHDLIVPKEDYENVIDAVLVDGLAQLKTQGKQITVNQLIAAAKIKGDWKAKKRGQDTEIIKMMYRGASGFTQKPPNLGIPGPN